MKIVEEVIILENYQTNELTQKIIRLKDTCPFQIRRYDTDEIVLFEGEEIDGLYIQISGRTKITTSVITGKALLLRFCSPVSIMGDIELIQNVDIQSQVSTIEETDFIFIDKYDVKNKLFHEIGFMQELIKHVTYKLQTCTTASRVNLLASVETRFASYLCTTRDSSNMFGKEMHTTDHQEIASLIGTTPRHLNRIIEKLCLANIIYKDKKQIVVNEWKTIEQISKGLRYE